jgi:hypothetical protein
VHFALTGAALDRKVAALRAHASQTAGLVDELGEDDFRRWWSTEAFVAAEPRRPETGIGIPRAVAASGGAR